MKKKIILIVLAILTIIFVVIGIIFMNKSNTFKKNNIEIIDATFSCNKVKEKIYEDKNYVYYLTCQKSNSVFVKFKDTNSKVLIKDAIKDGSVTMDELIKAKLDVIKEKK